MYRGQNLYKSFILMFIVELIILHFCDFTTHENNKSAGNVVLTIPAEDIMFIYFVL